MSDSTASGSPGREPAAQLPTALVTGATDGIGRALASDLVARGWRVGVGGRDRTRVAATVRALGQDVAFGVVADLADLASVRAAATEIRAQAPRLDALVANAGLVTTYQQRTDDGVESMLAVNHLGHAALVLELLDLLRAAAPSRVVSVASTAYARGALDPDDLGWSGPWDHRAAYARSKLANVVFVRALAARLPVDQVAVNAVHPGIVPTNLSAAYLRSPMIKALERVVATTPVRAAARVADMVTDTERAGVTGQFLAPSRRGGLRLRVLAPAAADPDLAERLWHATMRQLDVDPDLLPRLQPRPLRNPVLGDELLIDERAGHPDGTSRMRLHVRPGRSAPPGHVHPTSFERFRVISGVLDVRVAGSTRRLVAGDEVEVPPGVVHSYSPMLDQSAIVEVIVSPDAGLGEFLAATYELADAGVVTGTGGPPLPAAVALLDRYGDAIRLPLLPAALQRRLWSTLHAAARVARLVPPLAAKSAGSSSSAG